MLCGWSRMFTIFTFEFSLLSFFLGNISHLQCNWCLLSSDAIWCLFFTLFFLSNVPDVVFVTSGIQHMLLAQDLCRYCFPSWSIPCLTQPSYHWALSLLPFRFVLFFFFFFRSPPRLLPIGELSIWLPTLSSLAALGGSHALVMVHLIPYKTHRKRGHFYIYLRLSFYCPPSFKALRKDTELVGYD